eukprot:TRINITY_DN69398_c0_g1_i1.p1 TRINITY_DN69398_c0_g1~~TRINITY_DN69398_c0_g1_i1.p1  ORF type:complete len:324 (-),score=103.85 TRINITY_DN69398_c0_g1_i1:23-913(-)
MTQESESERAALSLKEVDEQKAAGGEHFRNGSFDNALSCYAAAMQALDSLGITNPLRSTLASNQALCLLKLERFAEAEERASAALSADSANSKAAYRRGLARLKLGDAQGALDDLQKAARLEPQNAEVRQKRDEAKQLVEEAPAPASEVQLAAGATSALGWEGGLYSEKQDLNEGRLAETYKEQKAWVKTITNWSEIKDISFADDGDKACVSVYMSLPGVQSIASNKVCVWFTATSLEVRVIDLDGSNWFYLAQELWGQIDPQSSTWKVRKDKLSLKLQKRASARSWDRWDKLRRI